MRRAFISPFSSDDLGLWFCSYSPASDSDSEEEEEEEEASIPRIFVTFPRTFVTFPLRDFGAAALFFVALGFDEEEERTEAVWFCFFISSIAFWAWKSSFIESLFILSLGGQVKRKRGQ